VSNVETLANPPGIDATGPSTFLLTLSGPGRDPVLHEARLGERLGDLLPGGQTPRGALMSGFFAGLVGPRIVRLPLSHRELPAEGTGLGCGAVRLLGDGECAVRVAADVMAYLERDNARQCGPRQHRGHSARRVPR
jgi:NADH:ubiquinone oxidoreductase subunit F (NADH-binding)